MKADTAERLTALALRMSDDLNGMVRDIQANEPDDEVVRLRAAIGRVMWTIYYEILNPTFEEHPALEPEAATEAGPATAFRPAAWGARSAAHPARLPAPGSRRPPERQRTRRRRLR